jgi:restriction system protein
MSERHAMSSIVTSDDLLTLPLRGAIAIAWRSARRVAPIGIGRLSIGFDWPRYLARPLFTAWEFIADIETPKRTLREIEILDLSRLGATESVIHAFDAATTVFDATKSATATAFMWSPGSEEFFKRAVERSVAAIGHAHSSISAAVREGYCDQSAVTYFEAAVRLDFDRSRSLFMGQEWPNWGDAIDPSDSGGLGNVWANDVPSYWDAELEGQRDSDFCLFTLIKNEVLLTQAIVTLHDRTHEGQIIQVVQLPFEAILSELERDSAFLFKFTKAPRRFEEFIAAIYDKNGFEVTLTPRSNDGGRDVIATKSGFCSIRILEQTKAYSSHNLVTHDDVRAMLGVLELDRNASKAIITTTSDFQPGVLSSPKFAEYMPHRLELRNGAQLRRMLLESKDHTI